MSLLQIHAATGIKRRSIRAVGNQVGWLRVGIPRLSSEFNGRTGCATGTLHV
jgi:hypothetical protein